MKFYEIVEQALVLLQRQGRVSYRALIDELSRQAIEPLRDRVIE